MHLFSLFFFNDTATTEIYTLSLHDALPICFMQIVSMCELCQRMYAPEPLQGGQQLKVFRGYTVDIRLQRSEEHTSELQSRRDLVCRLLLEKKKKTEAYSR